MSVLRAQLERLRARRTRQPDVAVVIPVYNAGPYLGELLDSLQAQTLDSERFEVIAVDDGSTDGSSAVLDTRATTMSNLHVVHQENSGWPGIPRNRGLDMSRARYVFFADADDVIAPEAMRRLVAFADRHGSDVVLPKMVGLDGRWVGERIYRMTQVDADLELAFKTLTPQKLFRVSLLHSHGIRFPEEKVRLEDGMVMAQAYLRASRVSILADQNYYHLRRRDDGGNISRTRLDPAGYAWSVATVSRYIRELDPDQARADRVILDLYRRKCLKIYGTRRWLKYRTTTKQAWLKAHGSFVEEFISPELEATLPARWIPRSQAVRSGSVEEADRTAVREQQLFDSPVTSVGVGVDGEAVLQLELPGGGTYDQVDVVATHRRNHMRLVLPVTVTGAADPSEAGATLVGIVAVAALEPLCASGGAIDLAIARTVDGHRGPEVRLQARTEGPGLFDPEVDPTLFSGEWYATPQGNLSLKIPRKSHAAS